MRRETVQERRLKNYCHPRITLHTPSVSRSEMWQKSLYIMVKIDFTKIHWESHKINKQAKSNRINPEKEGRELISGVAILSTMSRIFF